MEEPFSPASPGSQDTAATVGKKLPGATVYEVQRIEDLLRSVGKDPATTPLSEAKEIARILSCSAQTKDRNFYRWIFIILGIFVVATIIGTVILSLLDKPIPEGIVVIGSVSLGLFAGILVMSGRED
ncbi:MAG: hypothetical protein LUQ31_02440 [Methanoregula sp.]|nr:hypothetical protein [Methanoregula sp.]